MATLIVMLWVQSGASACACGEPGGIVVAKGQSLYGVPWRIRAKLERSNVFDSRAVEVHFSIGRKGDYSSAGYFSRLPLPLPPAFVFKATAGEEITDFPESDITGIAKRRVAWLMVEMGDGDSLTVRPTLAAPELLKRFPWLRGLRFFDAFFPAGQEPRTITAFDHDGQVLDQLRRHRGAFQ
ncbi:MAG TPA: hypothetical protein VF729_02620 [Solirubrobacterales bacterium]